MFVTNAGSSKGCTNVEADVVEVDDGFCLTEDVTASNNGEEIDEIGTYNDSRLL